MVKNLLLFKLKNREKEREQQLEEEINLNMTGRKLFYFEVRKGDDQN